MLITAIYSPKGGSGKTTIALNLAAELATRHPRRVLLFDLALPYNHAALTANLRPTSSLADAAVAGQEAFSEAVWGGVIDHGHAFGILSAAVRPEDAWLVSWSIVSPALEILAPEFDHVVVDLPVAMGETALALLDSAHYVVLVATEELAAARDISGMAAQIGPERLFVVLNHRQSVPLITAPEFEQSVGLEVTVELPCEGNRLEKWALDGQIAVRDYPNSTFSKGVRAIAYWIETGQRVQFLAPEREEMDLDGVKGRLLGMLRRNKPEVPTGGPRPADETDPEMPAYEPPVALPSAYDPPTPPPTEAPAWLPPTPPPSAPPPGWDAPAASSPAEAPTYEPPAASEPPASEPAAADEQPAAHEPPAAYEPPGYEPPVRKEIPAYEPPAAYEPPGAVASSNGAGGSPGLVPPEPTVRVLPYEYQVPVQPEGGPQVASSSPKAYEAPAMPFDAMGPSGPTTNGQAAPAPFEVLKNESTQSSMPAYVPPAPPPPAEGAPASWEIKKAWHPSQLDAATEASFTLPVYGPAPTPPPFRPPAYTPPPRPDLGRMPAQPPVVKPHAGRCTSTACSSAGKSQCSYIDSTGTQCESWWCDTHVVHVGGTPYCRRHAAIIKVLTANKGTLWEKKTLPAVNDRSIGLIHWLMAEVGDEVEHELRSAYHNDKAVTVAQDRSVRAVYRSVPVNSVAGEIANTRTLTWEWTCSASASTGYLTSIVVSVPVTNPPQVNVKVDQNHVLSVVPDWGMEDIGEHARQHERQQLRNSVVSAIRHALDSTVQWQMPAQVEPEPKRGRRGRRH